MFALFDSFCPYNHRKHPIGNKASARKTKKVTPLTSEGATKQNIAIQTHANCHLEITPAPAEALLTVGFQRLGKRAFCLSKTLFCTQKDAVSTIGNGVLQK